MSNAITKTERTLKDENGNPIINMNGSWTSKIYSLGKHDSYGLQLYWDNAAVLGTVELQYTCQPAGESTDVTAWTVKSSVVLDGTFNELMFLDALLPVASFRVVFTHAANGANLDSYITRKS